MADDTLYDLFIIGGGVNGCGIARDAQGRGLNVALAEMNDLGWATSSSSTKLFHGGLRYLEFFEFRLVKEALIEREILLSAMPHISWPMRFVLPFHRDMRFEGNTPTSKLLSFVMPWMKGRRPSWLIRVGLFLYDNMGGRKLLPATKTVDLKTDPVGAPLDDRFAKAFEYSDCWIEDSRLVILNARDAQARGANIMPRTKVLSADRFDDHWKVTVEGGQVYHAKCLVNAGGPWVEDIIRGTIRQNTTEGVRLVRGSHIVTKRLFDHDKCYFFQGEDGRIIFAIPYETDFTLIGTTDADHDNADTRPQISDEERDYLINFVNGYVKQDITKEDVVWTYAGVRPLYDDGATSATAATRDYVLSLDETAAPVLNIFGGKITTYRKLSKHALAKLTDIFPKMSGDWTAGVPMPGGDFPVHGVQKLVTDLQTAYPFLDDRWALRMIRAYGTEARDVLGEAKTVGDLGTDFGATLTEAELRWMRDAEFATCAEDAVWRRTKLGLRLSAEQVSEIDAWFVDN
ncbi:MAG: glycerol-3-phosphate dehydrogenase [Nereida ignava]|uniref:glycerol-3-phosphate dehydrogenase n=1 Tax=Nereida ignava TaxID=282199 RepID=UPI0030F97947